MNISKLHVFYGFILLIIICSIIFVSVHKSSILLTNAKHYKAGFSSVSGLSVGSDVRISGSNIGKVTKIWLNNDLQANIEMEITKPIDIPLDSYVVLHNIGLTGKIYVDIEPGAEEDPLPDNDWFDNTQGVLSLHNMLMVGLKIVKKKEQK